MAAYSTARRDRTRRARNGRSGGRVVRVSANVPVAGRAGKVRNRRIERLAIGRFASHLGGLASPGADFGRYQRAKHRQDGTIGSQSPHA
jgi:hypothetical protein